MSKEIEYKLNKIPILNILVKFGKKIKIPGLEGMSLYDVLEMYIIGIVEGALTTRAGGIAYSFFMAIFPFLLFIIGFNSFYKTSSCSNLNRKLKRIVLNKKICFK